MGDVVDVQPEYWNEEEQKHIPSLPHPIYRLGFALTLGWPSDGGSHA